MQHNKQTIIEGMKVLHKQMQAEGKTPQQIAEAFDQLHLKTGINYWHVVNKGKPQNRYNICVLGGHSGGGRTMSMYKSGHHV